MTSVKQKTDLTTSTKTFINSWISIAKVVGVQSASQTLSQGRDHILADHRLSPEEQKNSILMYDKAILALRVSQSRPPLPPPSLVQSQETQAKGLPEDISGGLPTYPSLGSPRT